MTERHAILIHPGSFRRKSEHSPCEWRQLAEESRPETKSQRGRVTTSKDQVQAFQQIWGSRLLMPNIQGAVAEGNQSRPLLPQYSSRDQQVFQVPDIFGTQLAKKERERERERERGREKERERVPGMKSHGMRFEIACDLAPVGRMGTHMGNPQIGHQVMVKGLPGVPKVEKHKLKRQKREGGRRTATNGSTTCCPLYEELDGSLMIVAIA